MAAINFPSNPNKNDIHTTHDDQKFIFDGSGWTPYFPASNKVYFINSTDTINNRPNNPMEGDFWFDTGTANLYLYYDDGTGSLQWVSVANGGAE